MRVERFQHPREFLDRALPLLMANEAANHLLIGITNSLVTKPDLYGVQPYLAICREGDGDVPVGVAIMTPPHNVLLALMPESVIDAFVDDLLDQRLPHFSVPGVLGANEVAKTFAERWQAKTGQSFRLALAERIYKLERVQPVAGVSGSLRRATIEDRDLLVRWMLGFGKDTEMPEQSWRQAEQTVDRRLNDPDSEFYLWLDPEPVSLAGFTGPSPNGMRVGPVYTPPEHRRHGYAAACTAAVSQLLLDAGRSFCFLFTDLDNPTTNHIYPMIGYEPVIDFAEYKLDNE